MALGAPDQQRGCMPPGRLCQPGGRKASKAEGRAQAWRSVGSGGSKGFFTLYRDSAQDARLSLEARGLFALMMSLPEDWEYSVSGLAVKAGCGKDRIRRILGELQDVGYLIREQGHDSGGKFSGNIYVLQDEAPPLSGKPDNGEQPETAPLSGNTVNGENRQRETPLTVNPTQKNIDLTEEEIKRRQSLSTKSMRSIASPQGVRCGQESIPGPMSGSAIPN